MNMSMGMEQRQTMRMEQRQTMSLDQILSQKLMLLQVLRLVRYSPEATCNSCDYGLNPMEIIKGFNQDPRDYTTKCPKCKARFTAKLITRLRHGSVELIFYCEVQALDQLKDLVNLSPEEIEKEEPAVYHSIRVHCGTLTNAFKKIGLSYPHEEKIDWKDKITCFLGQMPDTVIAECVGVSVYAIRKIRKKKKISSFRNK